eukprot:TRINITY_DN7106_c0_g1_i4.p1 TRINITY_DN7106_c0_g1~~TRINITY_DN7106_c0_g1_i4.p1  ORF type:complete len:750 (+),score=172.75 TRINITY_DN7106_c0_g1_i4:132-2381(+)
MRISSLSKGSHFIDTHFPPNSASLVQNPQKLSGSDAAAWGMYTWVHCSDLPDSSEAKVANEVSPLYVTQGQLGNCYFVSVLVSLGLTPERVRSLICPEVKASKKEKFSVSVYPMGIRTQITVDGYFPYLEGCQSLAFSKSGASELWPMILEKSWAKYLGSYHNAVGLSSMAAFTFLSGFPSISIHHAKTTPEELWKTLAKAQENKFAMVCSSIDVQESQEDEKYSVFGLVSKHAYTLVEVKEKQGAKRVQKVVKIRNPWGRLEWIGGVGTNSNIMPSSIIRKGEGMFYMNFEDFYKYFDAVTICNYQPTFFHETASLLLADNLVEYVVKVKVTKESAAYFQLILDFRKEMVPISMIIGYKNPKSKKVEYIASEQMISSRIFIEETLKKGKYICDLIIKDAKSQNHTNASFVVSTEGQHSVQLLNKRSKKDFYISSLLRTCILKQGKRERLAQGIYKYSSPTSILNNYFAGLYINFSVSTALYVEVQYADSRAVQILGLEGKDAKYQAVVKPREEKCICMKLNKSENGYRYTYKVLLDKPKLELIEEAHKGNLKKSSDVTLTKGFVYKSYQHDLGFIFEFANHTSDIIFNGKFEFTLTNLKIMEPCENDCLIIKLQPREVKYVVLKAKDPFSLRSTYSVSYMHESKAVSRSKDEIIGKLKNSGSEKKLQNNASIYSKYIDNDYYLLVTNYTEKTLAFTLTFSNIKNLECSEGESWKEMLKPNEREKIKVLKQRKVFKETECSYKISYEFI